MVNLTNFTNVTGVQDFFIALNQYYPLEALFLIPVYLSVLIIGMQKYRFPTAFLLANAFISLVGIPLVIFGMLDVMTEWFFIGITVVSAFLVWLGVKER
ncbi:MAG TPA: hypothetical protein ENG10_01100 [Candidatus Bathyarchaeota archaeon]|nr:hypothetical protein [Candidatus Bathyarchaeota archaeon]HEX68877.1 hypothetical protein [Candidatus Bathyarchaeota archaeon]